MRPIFQTRIYVTDRPYLLVFRESGITLTLSSTEAQRVIDAYPAAKVTAQRLTFVPRARECTILLPATIGGGPAFVVERNRLV